MRFFKWMVLILCLILTGCAPFSRDGGMEGVKAKTSQHIKQELAWPKTEAEQHTVNTTVNALLAKPMDVESAVQLALLNNKGLQSSFYALGISEADIVQAGRLPNPKFSMLYSRNNGDYKIEQALTFNIFSLVTRSKALEIERANFEKTKLAVVSEVLALAQKTRATYFNTVAMNQRVNYSQQVKASAEASSELAKRMLQAGNWNALEQMREQSFYADAVLDEVNSKNMQITHHESLARLLGVSEEQLNLENKLPDLPKNISDLKLFEQAAFEQRLDLQAMRLETQNLAKKLGLTKTTRWINVLDIGPARVLEGRRGDAYKKGFNIEFELPLFDWGDAKVARAEAIYMQSVNRTAQKVINAQSEIREAYSHYVYTYKMAKHYRDEIIPLRKKVLDEHQLRYNGMLISPFELFANARTQVTSVKTYIEKLNDFWLAETALNMALIGNLKEEND